MKQNGRKVGRGEKIKRKVTVDMVRLGRVMDERPKASWYEVTGERMA